MRHRDGRLAKSALRLLRDPGLGARYGRTGRESQSKLTRRSIAARQGRDHLAALLFIQPDVLSDPRLLGPTSPLSQPVRAFCKTNVCFREDNGTGQMADMVAE